jgi:16S rRNA processing protein RimM
VTGRRLEIGRIGRAHGLRGEVWVRLTTNREERMAPGARVYAGDHELLVAGARKQGDHWIVRFEGVDDRDAAQALRNHVMTADPIAGAPDDDELWAHEVVGAAVVERNGRALGTVIAIEANPAHDLLVLDDGTLVPVVFVVEHAPRRIVVDLPSGLTEL